VKWITKGHSFGSKTDGSGIVIEVESDGENNNTNNIPENAVDIISPNLQESMRSNNQREAIINHQRHK